MNLKDGFSMFLIGLFWVMLMVNYAANALDKFERLEMLNIHNGYRSEVGTPDLIWSEKLASMAQNYANKLKLEQSCKLVHGQAKGVGENLYWASAISYSTGEIEIQKKTAKQVADSWGSERAHYQYSSNSCAPGEICEHYTQMVLANTLEIGYAKEVCYDNSQIWIFNYYPAGNYSGEKPY